ncbi:MAG: class I SAM-dependent methyltransferase [Spartobacteria bacterium]|nr:class I SAM-dependent methyltransferase [Spartobacteria bacterium]
MGGRNILDFFVESADYAQNAVDIFKGEWATALPEGIGAEAGMVDLFHDMRIHWLHEQFDVKDKTVLELGPLEGAHSSMLEELGAARIVAVESNTHAYLKCLIVKELLQLQRTFFRCADFVEYLKRDPEKYDVCIASGVLYHMRNPVELLQLIRKASKHLFIWTHYYDPMVIEQNDDLAYRFSDGEPFEVSGYKHTLYRREYGLGLYSKVSLGGNAAYSHWLSREDILGALRHFGFDNIQVNFEDPAHANGPSFALTASRA